MKSLYADLKDKGLEIVLVTRFYGYYKGEQSLSEDQEYDRMKEFLAENGLPFPVVFGSTNFEEYGVSGIPHMTLIDRQGLVRSMKIGYSKESFSAFRRQIEEALGFGSIRPVRQVLQPWASYPD